MISSEKTLLLNKNRYVNIYSDEANSKSLMNISPALTCNCTALYVIHEEINIKRKQSHFTADPFTTVICPPVSSFFPCH